MKYTHHSMSCSWMKKAATLAQLLVLLSAYDRAANAVLYGDEIYQDVEGGKFWAFHAGGVSIVDPESCEIEQTVTTDHNGDPLPTAFNDGIYTQSKDGSEGYVLIGSRVDETNAMGDEISHMYAFSTNDREAISKAEVGSRVVHSYGVWPHNEFWMHSDGDGMFYVFDIDDLSKTTHDDIEAKVEDPAHGKLLWDESPELKNRSFGTSTREQFLFEFDMKTKEQTAAYDYSAFDIEGCRGLHAIAYSSANEHIYAECSGGGGALEFDVSNDSIQFVQQFPEANGALYETPDGRFVVAASKGLNAYYVFVPQGSGMKSSVEYTLPMKGNPSGVQFYTNSKNEVIACSPMTENINQNQRRDDGTIACDYYEGCTGAATADDVDAGVCLHGEEGTENELQLFRETTTDVADANVCARCKDESNFEINEDTGVSECICTPHCGSCDPEPKYSDDNSGFMCHNLSKYVDAVDAGKEPPEGTLIKNCGGMMPGNPYGGSAECTYGRSYRGHKRGMQYDAAIATLPTNSLVIIDMDKMSKKCTVELPDTPNKVVYAPNKPVDVMANGGVSVMSSASGLTWSSSLALTVSTMIVGFANGW